MKRTIAFLLIVFFLGLNSQTTVMGADSSYQPDSTTKSTKKSSSSSSRSKSTQSAQKSQQKKKEWNGVNSRTELKSKLDGTTWETVKPYAVTNFYYRFEIKGNKVIWSSASPTRNYDDPKNWGNPFTFNIHEIAEPRQGTYCVILKAPDEDAIENLVPTILVFIGKNAYYSLGGEMGPALKKVK